jgi:ribosomal 30S subunit maturation factor RimM
MGADAPDWRPIGRVVSVRPGKREARIRPERRSAHLLAGAEWLAVALDAGAPLRCKVAALRDVGDAFVAEFAAGVPRDTVAAMRGAEVVVPAAEWAPEEGVLDVDALAGFAAVDEATGEALGAVTGGFDTPAHPVLEIDRPGAGPLLVPAVDEVLVRIDETERRVVLRDAGDFALDA